MGKNKTKKSNVVFFAAVAVLLIAGIGGGIALSRNAGRSRTEISRENAMHQLEKKLKKIEVTRVEPRKATVEFAGNSLAAELPDISKYPLSVEGEGELNIEIITSTEKGGSGTDGWLNEAAELFNHSHVLINRKWATVSVRPIASGAAIDYIISGKYVPECFSPSNELWGEMLRAENVDIEMIEPRLAGNTAGILVNPETREKLSKNGEDVDISTIIDATIRSDITMGYTNPYASSTGLNFLVTALQNFDRSDMLSTASVAKFQQFQQNVPFVAYTTLQMRDAAKNGVLDAFVMEYQGYYNAGELRGYEFIPFGARHDSPLYRVGYMNDEQMRLANMFAAHCKGDVMQELAKKYGFNYLNDYKGTDVSTLSGGGLVAAQKLWKNEKDAGSPVMAVFVADTSGSMRGEPLTNLQNSLLNAMQYINESTYIGLVSYNSKVTVDLNIAKFDLNQRSYFTGAVKNLSASGQTATFDAVLAALDLLMDAQAQVEAQTGKSVKPLLFVLSDGETNVGNSLDDIRNIVAGLEVPCYTIGYNADISALAELSSINEAASINADSDDVVYSLKSLFNAQM